jgi:uncharacterized membrane protein YsdA (DUF1294 family)
MLPYYVAFIIVMSIITYCLYASDKKRARNKQWRISEKTLLLCSFFGGALGGMLAMKVVSHKTKHWYFTVVNLVGALWQILLMIYLIKIYP